MGAEAVVNSYQAVITSGQSISASVDLGPRYLLGIETPAALDTGTVLLSFLASIDGITYLPVYDQAGVEKTIVCVIAAAQHIVLDPTLFMGIRWLQIRAGNHGSPVAQTADRAFNLVTLPRPH